MLIAAAGMAALVSTSALAQSYTYNYAAATGTANSGSFTIFNNNGAFSLTAFNGTVGGVSYNLSTAGLATFGSNRVYLGGLLNGVNLVVGGTNDFDQDGSFAPGALAFTDTFSYAVAGTVGIVGSPTVNFTQVVAAAAVPEPATWGMVILGMGAVGYTMRRRKSSNMTRVSCAA